jgi:hypothetical protein
MDALGTDMEALGKEMDAATKRAEAGMADLIREARAAGKARPAK